MCGVQKHKTLISAKPQDADVALWGPLWVRPLCAETVPPADTAWELQQKEVLQETAPLTVTSHRDG